MNLFISFILSATGFFVFSFPLSVIFAEKNDEAKIYRALLAGAYQGKWYKMTNKTLPYEGFYQKNNTQRLVGEPTPFTGWYAQFDSNNTARLLCSFFEGVREGPVVQWDEDGVMKLRGAHQIGRKHGVFTNWNHRGFRISEQEYKNGKLDGWSYFWYDRNLLRLRLLFDEGKLIEATGWLPNGEICPHTRVEEGSGIIIDHESAMKLPQWINSYLKR